MRLLILFFPFSCIASQQLRNDDHIVSYTSNILHTRPEFPDQKAESMVQVQLETGTPEIRQHYHHPHHHPHHPNVHRHVHRSHVTEESKPPPPTVRSRNKKHDHFYQSATNMESRSVQTFPHTQSFNVGYSMSFSKTAKRHSGPKMEDQDVIRGTNTGLVKRPEEFDVSPDVTRNSPKLGSKVKSKRNKYQSTTVESGDPSTSLLSLKTQQSYAGLNQPMQTSVFGSRKEERKIRFSSDSPTSSRINLNNNFETSVPNGQQLAKMVQDSGDTSSLQSPVGATLNWKNVSPNVEIYHSQELSPENFKFNPAEHVEQSRKFDHARALDGSQGFDYSNVIGQNFEITRENVTEGPVRQSKSALQLQRFSDQQVASLSSASFKTEKPKKYSINKVGQSQTPPVSLTYNTDYLRNAVPVDMTSVNTIPLETTLLPGHLDVTLVQPAPQQPFLANEGFLQTVSLKPITQYTNEMLGIIKPNPQLLQGNDIYLQPQGSTPDNSHPPLRVQSFSPHNSHSPLQTQSSTQYNSHPPFQAQSSTTYNSHPPLQIQGFTPYNSHPSPPVQGSTPYNSHPPLQTHNSQATLQAQSSIPYDSHPPLILTNDNSHQLQQTNPLYIQHDNNPFEQDSQKASNSDNSRQQFSNFGGFKPVQKKILAAGNQVKQSFEAGKQDNVGSFSYQYQPLSIQFDQQKFTPNVNKNRRMFIGI